MQVNDAPRVVKDVYQAQNRKLCCGAAACCLLCFPCAVVILIGKKCCSDDQQLKKLDHEKVKEFRSDLKKIFINKNEILQMDEARKLEVIEKQIHEVQNLVEKLNHFTSSHYKFMNDKLEHRINKRIDAMIEGDERLAGKKEQLKKYKDKTLIYNF